MYERPVEIAAPRPPKFGTRMVFPIIFVMHANKADHICKWLFLKKFIPETVVSDIVYIIGLKHRQGKT